MKKSRLTIKPKDVPKMTMSEPVPAEEVGYCRVSTPDQSIDMQKALLLKRGIPEANIFEDVGSGGKMTRHGLDRALRLMTGRPGWTLVIYKLDRLGRTLLGLLQLAQRFEQEQWHLVSLTEQIDTRTPIGKFYFHMLAVFAQLERDMTIERTRAGIARRQELGFKMGRKSRFKPEQFAEMERLLLETNIPKAQIAKKFKIVVPSLDYFFPAWRSKTPAERREWRKAHPFNTR